MEIDYQAIVDAKAKELGVTVHDLWSDEAYESGTRPDGTPYDALLNAVEVAVYGDDPEQAAWMRHSTRQIFVSLPIRTELGCFIALHELGHHACDVRGEPTLLSEGKATAWAFANLGFEPSAETTAAAQAAFDTYLPGRRLTRLRP